MTPISHLDHGANKNEFFGQKTQYSLICVLLMMTCQVIIINAGDQVWWQIHKIVTKSTRTGQNPWQNIKGTEQDNDAVKTRRLNWLKGNWQKWKQLWLINMNQKWLTGNNSKHGQKQEHNLKILHISMCRLLIWKVRWVWSSAEKNAVYPGWGTSGPPLTPTIVCSPWNIQRRGVATFDASETRTIRWLRSFWKLL